MDCSNHFKFLGQGEDRMVQDWLVLDNRGWDQPLGHCSGVPLLSVHPGSLFSQLGSDSHCLKLS
jgi:hypothetical protein